MLNFRYAQKEDVDILFDWANDPVARLNSYNKGPIKYEDHVRWFNKRISSDTFYCYIFSDSGVNVGQVRIEKKDAGKEAIISISIVKDQRGKGYSTDMLKKASDDFSSKNKDYLILAYIFKTNTLSYKSFLKAGYELLKESVINEVPSFILVYKIID